ncbi:unnamed protein product [Amoebophrya sp. A25]|nr:unnamed protein product [Amoebophrya sp. A25]|eukprot:GSA25T00011817001.1
MKKAPPVMKPQKGGEPKKGAKKEAQEKAKPVKEWGKSSEMLRTKKGGNDGPGKLFGIARFYAKDWTDDDGLPESWPVGGTVYIRLSWSLPDASDLIQKLRQDPRYFDGTNFKPRVDMSELVEFIFQNWSPRTAFFQGQTVLKNTERVLPVKSDKKRAAAPTTTGGNRAREEKAALLALQDEERNGDPTRTPHASGAGPSSSSASISRPVRVKRELDSEGCAIFSNVKQEELADSAEVDDDDGAIFGDTPGTAAGCQTSMAQGSEFNFEEFWKEQLEGHEGSNDGDKDSKRNKKGNGVEQKGDSQNDGALALLHGDSCDAAEDGDTLLAIPANLPQKPHDLKMVYLNRAKARNAMKKKLEKWWRELCAPKGALCLVRAEKVTKAATSGKPMLVETLDEGACAVFKEEMHHADRPAFEEKGPDGVGVTKYRPCYHYRPVRVVKKIGRKLFDACTLLGTNFYITDEAVKLCQEYNLQSHDDSGIDYAKILQTKDYSALHAVAAGENQGQASATIGDDFDFDAEVDEGQLGGGQYSVFGTRQDARHVCLGLAGGCCPSSASSARLESKVSKKRAASSRSPSPRDRGIGGQEDDLLDDDDGTKKTAAKPKTTQSRCGVSQSAKAMKTSPKAKKKGTSALPAEVEVGVNMLEGGSNSNVEESACSVLLSEKEAPQTTGAASRHAGENPFLSDFFSDPVGQNEDDDHYDADDPSDKNRQTNGSKSSTARPSGSGRGGKKMKKTAAMKKNEKKRKSEGKAINKKKAASTSSKSSAVSSSSSSSARPVGKAAKTSQKVTTKKSSLATIAEGVEAEEEQEGHQRQQSKVESDGAAELDAKKGLKVEATNSTSRGGSNPNLSVILEKAGKSGQKYHERKFSDSIFASTAQPQEQDQEDEDLALPPGERERVERLGPPNVLPTSSIKHTHQRQGNDEKVEVEVDEDPRPSEDVKLTASIQSSSDNDVVCSSLGGKPIEHEPPPSIEEHQPKSSQRGDIVHQDKEGTNKATEGDQSKSTPERNEYDQKQSRMSPEEGSVDGHKDSTKIVAGASVESTDASPVLGDAEEENEAAEEDKMDEDSCYQVVVKSAHHEENDKALSMSINVVESASRKQEHEVELQSAQSQHLLKMHSEEKTEQHVAQANHSPMDTTDHAEDKPHEDHDEAEVDEIVEDHDTKNVVGSTKDEQEQPTAARTNKEQPNDVTTGDFRSSELGPADGQLQGDGHEINAGAASMASHSSSSVPRDDFSEEEPASPAVFHRSFNAVGASTGRGRNPIDGAGATSMPMVDAVSSNGLASVHSRNEQQQGQGPDSVLPRASISPSRFSISSNGGSFNSPFQTPREACSQLSEDGRGNYLRDPNGGSVLPTSGAPGASSSSSASAGQEPTRQTGASRPTTAPGPKRRPWIPWL